MAKKKKTKNNVSRVNSKSESKKQEKQFSEDASFSGAIKLIIVVFIILLVFYLLTVVILSKKSSIPVSNASIQYTKILAGESFDQKEKDYYVFYYSMDDDNSTSYADLVSKYREKENPLPIYTVDLSEGFNKKYLADTENKVASKASELKINGTTLIHFKDNKIDEYITSSFENYLDVTVE